MKNKTKELPQAALIFSNILFLLCILFSIFLVAYGIYKIYNLPLHLSRLFYIYSILFGVVFTILFSLGLKRLSNNIKANLSILFFTIGITIYTIEAYLNFFLKPLEEEQDRKSIALKIGVPYDARTKMEILNDLKNSNINTFPNYLPSEFRESNGLASKKNRIYPLGSISNSTTIFGNESGYYPIIETDEYGFNNPKGLYIENEVDIMLVGDSFAAGVAVNSNESIGAVLRELDFNTISVGKGGNGPLLELASLKEYAKPLRPKIVLWIYYTNDLKGLDKETKSPILKKYLTENDYSQNLISRQKEIDIILKNYDQIQWKKQKNKKEKERRKIEKIINSLKLTQLRKMINLTPTFTSEFTNLFKDVLKKSKQTVLEWDGKMYFIYLPDFNRYSRDEEHMYRDFVMQTADELNIPIIDVNKEVFDSHPDPLSLFPLRVHGHYTAEGYRLIAETVVKRLEEDGYVPIKSKK